MIQSINYIINKVIRIDRFYTFKWYLVLIRLFTCPDHPNGYFITHEILFVWQICNFCSVIRSHFWSGPFSSLHVFSWLRISLPFCGSVRSYVVWSTVWSQSYNSFDQCVSGLSSLSFPDPTSFLLYVYSIVTSFI